MIFWAERAGRREGGVRAGVVVVRKRAVGHLEADDAAPAGRKARRAAAVAAQPVNGITAAGKNQLSLAT